MSRPKAHLVLELLLFLAVGLAVSAQNDENASENAILDNDTVGRIWFMFVQEAGSGTFVKNADGNYTLTLLNVVPYTMYFSDPPEQIAGFASMERFIAGYSWRYPYPNAALSLVDADENEDTVILAISKPLYDNGTGTLTYTAQLLEDLVNDRFGYHISRADAGIPEKFGRAALFIDDCRDGHIYCCKTKGDKLCGSGTNCGKISIGCCWNDSYLSCNTCYHDSYYREKCKKEHGEACNDWYRSTCFF
jgi:hypothetical protein